MSMHELKKSIGEQPEGKSFEDRWAKTRSTLNGKTHFKQERLEEAKKKIDTKGSKDKKKRNKKQTAKGVDVTWNVNNEFPYGQVFLILMLSNWRMSL